MIDIERLLESLDLVRLAEEAGAKLKKSGGQYRAACPIHGGDNPTMFVIRSPREARHDVWFCYKCNEGGDALRFIEKARKLSFIEAVKFGAEKAGLHLADLGLTPEAAAEHEKTIKRRDVLDVAARFYTRHFRRTPHAIEYALNRRFMPRTLTRFGYSNGRGLHEHLLKHSADIALAHEMGLLRHDGRDFTSNHDGDAASPTGWLIYIHRINGRVDYVSARALAPVDPKDKSRNLPGKKKVYRAEVRADQAVVLVEGQACAETLHQFGISAWALCGASLDDDAVRTLARRKAVYLALDDDAKAAPDDDAVQTAMAATATRRQKLADALGPLTLISTEIPHEGAKDVNDWLKARRDLPAGAVRAWLKASKPWIEHRISSAVFAGPLEQADHVQGIAHQIARLPQPVQAKWYRVAGKALNMTPAEIKATNGQSNGIDHHAAEIKNGCLALYGVPLMTASALITQQYTIHDGQNPPRVVYTISGRLAQNNRLLRELYVSATDFDQLNWLAEWGAHLIRLVPRGQQWQIARAVQELSLPNLKEEVMYAYGGWATIDSQNIFLSGNGGMGKDGLVSSIKIDLGEAGGRFTLEAPPTTPEATKIAVRASLDFLTCGPLHVTAPLWAAVYAAPLSSIRSLDAVIWVYGSSGSGKSSISHTAAAHFGKGFIGPRKFFPLVAWSATASAIEGVLFAGKDHMVIIDDYAPQFVSGNEQNALKKRASEVIRSVGNRMARARSNSDLTAKAQRNPRALVIATAENPIDGQSLMARLLFVPIEKGDVLRKDEGNPAFDKAQAHAASGLYAQAMALYLQWLARNWERAKQLYLAGIEKAVAASRDQVPPDFARLPDYYAILDSAQTLAHTAFHEMGVITSELAEMYSENNRAAIMRVVTAQSGRIGEQSPAQMFCRAIESLLDRKKIYLAAKRRSTFTPPDKADLVGWFDPEDVGAVWLKTDDALAWAKTYWNSLDVHFDTTVDSLRRIIKQAPNLLRATDKTSGQAEVSIWTGTRNGRALEIDVKVAYQLWGIDLRYPRTVKDGPDATDTEDFS